jgi:hypothetical protein
MTVAATQQQTTLVYASMGEEEEGSGGSSSGGQEQCSVIPSTDPDLKGWSIETCSDDGDQTWISPEGKRCVANEASGNVGCEGGTIINTR